MLSARTGEIDKVTGLELGAEDYVAKPFSLAELLARIRAALRRAPRLPELSRDVHLFGDVRVDVGARTVSRGGAPVDVTATEFDVLVCLLQARGSALPRERRFFSRVWGPNHHGTPRTIDNFIQQLRAKLEPDASRPRHVVTVRGVGYRLDPEARPKAGQPQAESFTDSKARPKAGADTSRKLRRLERITSRRAADSLETSRWPDIPGRSWSRSGFPTRAVVWVSVWPRSSKWERRSTATRSASRSSRAGESPSRPMPPHDARGVSRAARVERAREPGRSLPRRRAHGNHGRLRAADVGPGRAPSARVRSARRHATRSDRHEGRSGARRVPRSSTR